MAITTRSISTMKPSGTPPQLLLPPAAVVVPAVPAAVTPETTTRTTITTAGTGPTPPSEEVHEATVVPGNIVTEEFPRTPVTMSNAPPHLPVATLQESLELAVLGPTATVMDIGAVDDDEAVLNLDAALAQSKTRNKTAGQRLAEGQTVHSEEYGIRKKRYIRNFLDALKKEEKWKAFLKPTREVPDFFEVEEEGGTVEAVFVLLYPGNGMDRNKKVRTLSDMLIDWVNGMEISEGRGGKKNKEKEGIAKRWHAPATINVMIRSFLAATKDCYGWDFAISEFNHVGGFNAFLKNLFDQRQKIDVSNC